MKTERKVRRKLSVLQGMLAERAECEKELAQMADRVRVLRKRIRSLDAALALESTQKAEPYHQAIEEPTDAPRIAGRIGYFEEVTRGS